MADRSRWFVSTEWLAGHLGDPHVVVVDATWHLAVTGRDGRKEYEAGHIPGAVFFDIDAIADKANPLPHMLPSPAQFAAAVGALGIGDGDRIVVYDGLGLSSAPRVWWTFRVMGARDVVILEGGLPRWKSEGRPLATAVPSPAPRIFTPAFDADGVKSMEEVRRGLSDKSFQVVDARPRARFLGEAPEPRSWVRSGRMPGSLGVPSGDVVGADGALKDDAALRAAFAAGGVALDRPVVTSCGSGVNAAILSLALDVLGAHDTALYDGSWTEWGGRDDMPVATGPAG
jgi:thiosulfate/3-mercaptopyruvate sulfurtransferase